MSQSNSTVTFERLTELDTDAPTLIEGLPGHGLVASIAVEQITTQLRLEHHGNIVSAEFPPVTSFKDGRVRDPVRVYAGDDPPVMTLQSDVALPGRSLDALTQCILDDLTSEFERAIFLAGAPAESEDEIGDVFGVATSELGERRLLDAGIELGKGFGLIGGITGALVAACYHADVPATVLVVKANPYLPDPTAARSVIENALEPLVQFDIDTTALEAQAEQIKSEMEQIAQRYRESLEPTQQEPDEPIGPTMYQ
ncbi:MAG: proteasome assembly chaperone family protein [Halapricum sp.]